MDNNPTVAFISCTDESPEDLIKLTLDRDNLEVLHALEDGVTVFPWHIDNKYYTADVNIASLKHKTLCSEEFSDSVEAVVLHFDSYQKSTLELAESWLPFINTFEPEVKILLCKNSPESSENEQTVSKVKAQEWCIERGFELVEIEPDVCNDDDLEDDFPETTGVKRIVQALHAHIWPNLIMKTEENRISERHSANERNNHIEDMPNGSDSRFLEESIEELLESDGGFSDIFSRLNQLKSQVGSLTGAERKEAAEEVVMAFWRAMGGDEEEVTYSDT